MNEEKKINKSSSRVCMTLTSSTGTWLNDCLQKQMMYVSLSIDDPDGNPLARVAMSYEQAARMLLYNGDVPCTLERYRNSKGELVAEKVVPPETVHQRMKARLGNTQQSIANRLEDIRRDLYDMVNGDGKRGKTALKDILREVEVAKSHFESNQSFVLQQAEEELGQMQSNAAGQLGTFLQSKLGIQAPEEILKALVNTGVKQLSGPAIEPETDDYKLRPREPKPIAQMTVNEVADHINARFHAIEKATPTATDEQGVVHLYNASARAERGDKVVVKYVAYQGDHAIDLPTAKRYLGFLSAITPDQFKTHWTFEKKAQNGKL
jgi:hypothetical protein